MYIQWTGVYPLPHTCTAPPAAGCPGDVQGEPYSHQGTEDTHPWIHGRS